MMLSDVYLTSVTYIRLVGGVCGRPAAWRVLAESGPARPAWLKAAAACFRCRPGRRHIVAAARLQLVGTKDDGVGGDNWGSETCKAPVTSVPPFSEVIQVLI